MTQTAKDEAERIATPGAVTWHSSEEDAGPDVGIEIGIGGDSTLWVGEVSDRLLEEQKIDANKFGGSCGWWLIHYREKESQVFGKFADAEIARSFADLIADALRSARANFPLLPHRLERKKSAPIPPKQNRGEVVVSRSAGLSKAGRGVEQSRRVFPNRNNPPLILEFHAQRPRSGTSLHICKEWARSVTKASRRRP